MTKADIELDAIEALTNHCRDHCHDIPFNVLYGAVAALGELRQMAHEYDRMSQELDRIFQEARAEREALDVARRRLNS